MSVTEVSKGIWVLVGGRYPTRFDYLSADGALMYSCIVGAGCSMEYSAIHPLPMGEWTTTELPLTPRKPNEDVLIRDMLKAIQNDLNQGKYSDGEGIYAALDKVEISLEYLDRYQRAWRMVNGKKQWFRLVPDYDTDADDD